MNNYLEKLLFIIENNSKELPILPNNAKLIIHSTSQLKTDFVVVKNTELFSVAKKIKKLHIRSDLHFICKKNVFMINNME